MPKADGSCHENTRLFTGFFGSEERIRMLAAGDDCDSLLVQASAVRSALNGVLVGLMEAHLESCVVPCARTGKSDEALGRFRQALETVLKRS
jgi:DNA-binding FrmR family transcriptional regulator